MYDANDFIIKWSNGIIWRQFLFRKKKPWIQSLMGLLQQSDITNCFTVIILSLCDVLWYNVFNTTQKKHIRTAIILITFSSCIYSTTLCCALLRLRHNSVIIEKMLDRARRRKWFMFSHARQRVILGAETRLFSQIAGGAVVNRCDSQVKEPVLRKIVLSNFRWPF